MRRILWLTTLAVLGALFFGASGASACGGLFCQNVPVNQAGERIVFSVNANETVTSLVQIQYTGRSEDFSWILPLPEAIGVDDLVVPEDGEQVFTDLHNQTDVQIIAPPQPDCALRSLRSFDSSVATSAAMTQPEQVEVFASGEVGPFGFDVIGAGDPDALITWLRDNNYRVEPSMEPLINVYVEEEFAFVAMRLLDGQDVDAISPIEITYPGTKPMIPLRLTAVAANPEMPIFVWIFAEEQAIPSNFEHMEIANEELTFFPFGGNDYQQLIQMRADALGGQAFITEFAGPADSINVDDNPYLRDLSQDHPYVTRLVSYISPEEMTVDPVFELESNRSDVSNIRDASQLKGLYACERDQGIIPRIAASDAINPVVSEGEIAAVTPDEPAVDVTRNRLGLGAVMLMLGAVAVGSYVFLRTRLKS